MSEGALKEKLTALLLEMVRQLEKKHGPTDEYGMSFGVDAQYLRGCGAGSALYITTATATTTTATATTISTTTTRRGHLSPLTIDSQG